MKLNHSYVTPQFVRVPIINGSMDYLNWIDDCVRKEEDKGV